ncbi:MAG: UDP-N-acetylglucosamine 1-carboxyvinyltransferase [Planctomycetes bacterium]|nr:UDP-N-acetylglucosamine 1-carboxyvinyltransferase [Planctomycetota bacterium]
MDMFVVRGGKPLAGRVRVEGAKNSALPIMAAALLADGETVLRDVPNLVDVTTLAELLRTLGMKIERRPDRSLSMEVVDQRPVIADYELVRKMRASFCVLGPLLARRGRACVSLPGGCNIGDRPIELHLKGLRALGADIRVEKGYVLAEVKRLHGNRIYLGGPFGSTVTGTCNVLSAAVLAEGETIIEAAACEPEVIDLGNLLNAMGAKIEGLGTPFLRIEGVDRLIGIEHRIIPDRIEAATLMVAAAITGGCIELENVNLNHLTAVVEKLREIGVRIDLADESPTPLDRLNAIDALVGSLESNSTDIAPPQKQTSKVRTEQPVIRIDAPLELRAVDATALPYPGLPTDVQAQFMSLLCLANGISVVTDKVFPDRFLHAAELARLGATIRREGPSAIISGVRQLSGACIMASDLRASAALVLAGLAAEGETVVKRIYHLDRGYEFLERKLNSLGADITRVEDNPENMPRSLCLLEATGEPPASFEAPHFLKSPNSVKSGTTPPLEEP